MNKRFEYNYSAPTEEERKEIDSIRRQYTAGSKEESKLERLRALDKRVKSGATALGLSLGIGGCLLFGLGLSMVLEWELLAGGIAVAVVGTLPVAFAGTAYKWVLARNKKKYGGEILRLSEELLHGEK